MHTNQAARSQTKKAENGDDSPIRLFVPFFRTDECLAEMRESLDSGWTGLGDKTIEFENAWCKYTGLPNAHFVNSATAGLHLAVHILKQHFGWQDGDEVITTPITFVSTNHAILYERLKPIFADVDEYLCLSPESVLSRITKKTRAVVFVGLGGNTGRLAEIKQICQQHNIALILDAAHMSGTTLCGSHVGSEAHASIFSFHSVKNLPTADSGVICFRSADLDKQARKLSWLGIDKDTYMRTQETDTLYRWKYNVEEVGFKYHGNSMMAALALVGLKYLDEDNAFRREICAIYDEELQDRKDIGIVRMSPGCVSSRHLYQVLVPFRDEVMVALNRDNIFPGVHYADNTDYPMYSYARNTCPNAAAASKSVLTLPLHLRLSHSDARRVARSLIAAVDSLKAANTQLCAR